MSNKEIVTELEIDQILKKICAVESFEGDNDTLIEITDEINKYYSNIGRHSYAEISTYIYDMDPQDEDYLIKNLIYIMNYYEDKGDKDNAAHMFKLIDHIRLEFGRVYKSVHKNIDTILPTISDVIKSELSQSIQEIDKKKEDIKKIMKITRAELSNINSNVISVLGIFTAIIVAFFGGLNILQGIFDNMHKVSIYRLILMSTITLTGLFNIMFVLLQSIAKLTGKNIWSSCYHNNKCNGCNKKKFTCFYNKYPIVVFYNIVSIIILVIAFYNK